MLSRAANAQIGKVRLSQHKINEINAHTSGKVRQKIPRSSLMQPLRRGMITQERMHSKE
jgi:hypothetical protein